MTNSSKTQSLGLRRNERGMTMLEVTLLLGALVIVSAAVAPALLRTLNEANAKSVRAEMEALHTAIMGDPATGTFGYIGDIGRFPNFMDELVLQLDQPFYVHSEASGVGFGWNGPYVTAGRDANDFRLDPWGNPYDIGIVGSGQVRSAGPNGIYDDTDDMVYPPFPVDPYGSLIVAVKGHSGDSIATDPEECVVALVYSADGLADAVLDELPPFSFEAVHRGPHEIEVTCATFTGAFVSEFAVVSMRGGGAQQIVELHVELGEEIEERAGGAVTQESATQSDALSGGMQR